MRASPTATALTATIHLVRHGEVENPTGVIYGRLPGYHLSERGRAQASATAERLREADVGEVWSSPLERARETAVIIAEAHGAEVVTDDRLTESDTTFEGAARSLVAFLRTPRHWWGFRNPLRPSWGESFVEIGARMVSAVHDAVARSGGRELVVVSHQTPVRVARLALARRRVPPWLPLTRCSTGSVTTLVFRNGTVIGASYFEPSA